MTNTRVDYCYADPAGNITVLVETPFPPETYPDIAARLLSAEPSAEQVGFIENLSSESVSLRMAGGEFCGNAAFSAASLAAMKSGADEGTFSVDFYGLDHPLSASLKRISEQSFAGKIGMPFPEEISRKLFSFQGTDMFLPVVRFPGISHIICTDPLDPAFVEAALKQWCTELESPAAGIMQLDQKRRSLTPLVYVPGADTLCWERSCASGTCAAAVWLSSLSGQYGTYSFTEPGGELGAETGSGFVNLLDSVTLSVRSTEI